MTPFVLLLALFAYGQTIVKNVRSEQNPFHRFKNNTFNSWQMSPRFDIPIDHSKRTTSNTNRNPIKHHSLGTILDGTESRTEDLRNIEGTWRRFWFGDNDKNVVIMLFEFTIDSKVMISNYMQPQTYIRRW